MSFLSSSPREADLDRRRHGGRGKKAEEEVPALDMLDDFWFFSNSLGGGRNDGKGASRPPLLPKSPSTSSAGRTKSAGADDQLQGSKSRFHDASGGRRLLLRTPSLPSPRIGMEQQSKDEELVEEDAGAGDQATPAEVEDDDMNWSKIYEGVLRTRIAKEEGRGSSPLLHRAPSTPFPSYGREHGQETAAGAATRSTPSLPRLRHSHSTFESHCRSHTPIKPDRTPTRRGRQAAAAEQSVASRGASSDRSARTSIIRPSPVPRASSRTRSGRARARWSRSRCRGSRTWASCSTRRSCGRTWRTCSRASRPRAPAPAPAAPATTTTRTASASSATPATRATGSCGGPTCRRRGSTARGRRRR